MEISLEKYEEMQDRIAKLETENMFRVKQVRHLLDYIVERDEVIFRLRAKQPHWISVKDITPDDDGEVLACYGKDVFIAHFEGDGWVVYVQAEDDCLYQQSVKVSHWIPLPEPPEK